MGVENILSHVNESNVVYQWDDAHRISPAPRHRRRLIVEMIADLGFRTCLDAGCAQPYLLQDIVNRFNVAGFGCDISDQVMLQNRRRAPSCQFEVVDLTGSRWPDGRTFDLVICSEVLEHLVEWESALDNLIAMTRDHLLITVPSGDIRLMDRLVGHHQHFQGPELISALEVRGCAVTRIRRWGFPIHSLYKVMISSLGAERLYKSVGMGQTLSISQRVISVILYCLFFLNDLFHRGDQLIVLARRRPS
jgi:SAM-dependent methyltransferase